MAVLQYGQRVGGGHRLVVAGLVDDGGDWAAMGLPAATLQMALLKANSCLGRYAEDGLWLDCKAPPATAHHNYCAAACS